MKIKVLEIRKDILAKANVQSLDEIADEDLPGALKWIKANAKKAAA